MDEKQQAAIEVDEAQESAPEQANAVPAGEHRPAAKKKKKRKYTWLKVIIWILVIALVVYLTMFLAVKISDELEDIPDLIRYIWAQFT